MPKHAENGVEMFVVGLVLDPVSNAPIVVLKDSSGDKCLPIWIGVPEATSIASALKKVEVVRPMTHDLLRHVIDELGAKVTRILIHSLAENTFFAAVEIVIGEQVKSVDARPSDAIAIAVRVRAPIIVAQEVLDAAQVNIVALPMDAGGEVEEEMVVGEEESLDRNFASIEKEQWAEILEEMDPDDFKYKM